MRVEFSERLGGPSYTPPRLAFGLSFDPADRHMKRRPTSSNSEADPLPEFIDPPVTEVALSVQFAQKDGLDAPRIGLLWSRFRDRFPLAEQHPPLASAFETFTRPRPAIELSVEMTQGPIPARYWFLNEDRTELIQVQHDRFIHNWRKVGGDEQYPRYEHIREAFIQELETFRAFLREEDLGDLEPNQCEVTYVNHIDAGEHSHPGSVFSFWADEQRSFLPAPESFRLGLSYLITPSGSAPLGRLHVNAHSAVRNEDGSPLVALTLVARGSPVGEGTAGAVGFLDMGREWIVRGFASITTNEMHENWRRTQ